MESVAREEIEFSEPGFFLRLNLAFWVLLGLIDLIIIYIILTRPDLIVKGGLL